MPVTTHPLRRHSVGGLLGTEKPLTRAAFSHPEWTDHTAHALARFATHGQASVEAQSTYLRALASRHGACFEAILGRHSFDRSGTLLPAYEAGQDYDRGKRHRVWKLEEKQTDVNLALAMYRDACRGLCDRLILVSNDSDAAPALAALREDFPMLMVGVVSPLRPVPSGGAIHRRTSGSLRQWAHWTVDTLCDEWLQEAQLPDLIPTLKKPLRKPAHW